MATVTRGLVNRGDLALWDGRNATASRIDATGGTITGLAIGNTVDVLQVFGAGTNRTNGTIADAISRIGSDNVTLEFSTGTWTIAANTTIPSNFTCVVPPGCVFDVSSGVTLTFACPVIAFGAATHASGSGTVVGLDEGALRGGFYRRTVAEIAASVIPTNYQYPPGDLRRYGAVGDGATSCATAWASANSQAAQSGAPIIVPRTASGFATGAALTVDYRSDVHAENGARLIYTGSSNIVVLTVGDTTNVAQDRTWRMPTIERTATTWASEDSVGVRFRNCTDCKIHLPLITGHTIAMQTLPAGGNGFQHNVVYLGGLYNAKICIDLSNVTSGYTNENTFHDGRFTVFTGTNSTLARYAVRVTSSDSSYLSNNNNVFLHPSIELNNSDASAEAVPILMVHGQQNKFLYCRDEINDTPFARESNASSGNWYDVGYFSSSALPTIECSSSAPSYKLSNSGLGVAIPTERQVFDSGPMHKNWNNYDGVGGAVHIPGVHLGFSGSSSTVFTAATGVTPSSTYLEVAAGGPGIFVNTDECKQFVVSRQCVSGRGGRVIVVCYDAIDGGGSIITTASSVLGSGAAPFSLSAGTYGGCFTTGSDSNDDVMFTVTTAVKSVRVLIVAGTSTIQIRQFSIRAINTHLTPGTYLGFDHPMPGVGLATAVPTTGTYVDGKLLWNAAPAAGGSPGWVCTTPGTPGTWKTMAAVAA